jgi:spermidine synthase
MRLQYRSKRHRDSNCCSSPTRLFLWLVYDGKSIGDNIIRKLSISKSVLTALLASALTLTGTLLIARTCSAEPTILDTFDSPYNHVIVLQEADVIMFKRMENGAILSAIDRTNPARQVISYTRYLFAPALFRPAPERVLNVGLGAGAINRLFAKLFPDTFLVSVDIDPMIVDVAVKYTDFVESPKNRVVIQDGRVFLRRDKRKWDWIIIDAFVKRSQIPPHLTTLEFYQLVSDRLTDRGVMAINLHAGSRLFDSQAATLRAAFRQVLFFRVGNAGNVIALGADYAKPSLLSLLKNLDPETLPDARAYEVDFAIIKNSIVSPDAPLLNRPGKVLIDDYAPVEFLELLKSE